MNNNRKKEMSYIKDEEKYYLFLYQTQSFLLCLLIITICIVLFIIQNFTDKYIKA